MKSTPSTRSSLPLPLSADFPQKLVVQRLFRLFPGFHRVFKPGVAAQIVPFSLEADHSPPALLGREPIHTGNAAGVVVPYGFGCQHFHAGAVHVSQARQARLPPSGEAPAAGGVSAAQAVGADHRLPAAVAPAQPGRPPSDVLRRPDYGQLAEPLSCQIQFFPGVSRIVRPLSVDKIYLLSNSAVFDRWNAGFRLKLL